MKKINLLLFSIISVSFLNAQNLPSTLLWKISGNGLDKPSYLYGTMHLTDERIFNLGDSLYKAIELSDGFAIEVNPDDLTDLMIAETKRSINEARKVRDILSEKDFKKYGPALAKKLNKDEDDITTEDVFQEKNKWVRESYSKGKMTTFLDAYLYDIARRQGKWTGGVEDMEDQENVMDYFIDKSDIQQLTLEDDNNSKSSKKDNSTEALINYYIKNDLNAIQAMSDFDDSLYRDALLTKRNIKMAMRMDSMSHVRTMVFAVGAAHLPGDDGLIELLKQKGFTLTPVFSSKKIKPKDYKVAEVPLVWQDVKDPKGYYTVSMPGKAGDLNMYGILTMKMYFDIFSSTAYFTAAASTPYNQSITDSVFESMSSYYFGTKDLNKGKPITINGVNGKEFVSSKGQYSHGYLLSKDGTLYIAIGMSMKKDTSAAGNINRFLKSFKIEKVETGNGDYISYTDHAKAYAVDLPAQPNPGDDYLSKEEQKSISSSLNISIDPKTGAYLMFGVNEASKGYFIESETATLKSIEESQKSKFSSVSIDTIYTKNGHKVLEYGGMMSTAPLMLKANYYFRGNRWYALVAVYDSSKANSSVDRFFSSFKILDYANTEWKNYTTEDKVFSTWSPSSFEYKTDVSEYTDDTTNRYESFDTTRADNFSIIPETFNKYYWQQNDSIFWKKLLDNIPFGDTLISKKQVINGGVYGYEIVTQKKDDGNISRKRMLLNGDKLYTMQTVQAVSEINNKNNNRFFEEFRFKDPAQTTTLFNSKAKQLLQDLYSVDSATHSEARTALRSAPFSQNELPMLQDAFLKTYNDDDESTYYNTNNILKTKIIELGQPESFTFAKDHYLTADDDTKNRLLDIMASFPTNNNFNDIKDLLIQSPPKKEWNYTFTQSLEDTLALTAKIFPDLLPFLKDTIAQENMLEITESLLDSNLLSTSLLQPYYQDVISLTQKRYKALKSDADDYNAVDYSLIGILGRINSAETNSLLQSFSTLSKHLYIQLKAIDKLLANNQQVNTKSLQTLAADRSYRTDLYDKLKAHKKEALFPKQFLTQKYFAESYIYNAASDDDEPSDMIYLTQKIINFNGVQSRFFFYKVTYGEGEYESNTLACSGPFSLNETDMTTDKASAELYYDEDFDPTNLPAQMDALIKQMEEWSKKEEEK